MNRHRESSSLRSSCFLPSVGLAAVLGSAVAFRIGNGTEALGSAARYPFEREPPASQAALRADLSPMAEPARPSPISVVLGLSAPGAEVTLAVPGEEELSGELFRGASGLRPASEPRRKPAPAKARGPGGTSMGGEGRSQRIGIRRGLPAPITVRSDQASLGAWRVLADGRKVWLGRIESAGAQALRVHFEHVALPPGATIVVFNPDDPREAWGPYDATSARATTVGDAFWSAAVFAQKVAVECCVPASAAGQAVGFVIREIGHRLAPTGALREGASERFGEPRPTDGVKASAALRTAAAADCQIDAACRPAWVETAKSVASVVVIKASGEEQCTGCLVADGDPAGGAVYFYTAHHCIENQVDADNAEFYWLYQSAACNGPPPALATVPRTQGAEFLAGVRFGAGSDAVLLRLRQPAPAGVTAVAWTLTPPAPDEPLAVLHHPEGGARRISFGRQVSFTSDFYHLVYSEGATDVGSSGGPLLNARGELLGHLRGGTAACETPAGLDQFGRFDAAFPVFQDWLLGRFAGVANDHFVHAQPIEGASGTLQGNSGGASREAGEPDHEGNRDGRTVWFRWTAPASGPVSFHTVGSSFDTILAVYTGESLAQLNRVAGNDDFDFTRLSRVSFPATAGTTYRIVVDGFLGAAGRVVLNWQPGALSNDDFEHARVITGATGEVSGANVGMSKQPGEPAHAGNAGGASIWYRWRAPASGAVTFDTEGSVSVDLPTGETFRMDTLLAVYRGSTVGTLTEVAANDDIDAGAEVLESRVSFNAQAGTEYFLAVDGARSEGGLPDQGEVRLTWHQPGAGGSAPANDAFAAAQRLNGGSGSISGSNVKATNEAGEPVHAGSGGGQSVWFRWVAPVAGLAAFETQGSAFDTVLAVYQGNTLAGLSPVAANDDIDEFTRTSRVVFPVAAGGEYRLAVDGYRTGSGRTRQGGFMLHWSTAPGAGGNDHFAAAQVISGRAGRAIGTNVGASKEPGEPPHAGNPGGKSIWFRWAAEVDGPAVFDTLGSTFDTTLAVYTGATWPALRLVLSDDDINPDALVYQSRVRFNARAGVEYRIVVDGLGEGALAEAGAVTLNWAQTVASPIVLTRPRLVDAGAVQFTLRGDPGDRYDVEVSPDLRTWTVLASVSNTTGEVVYTDRTTVGAARRFYRARLK